LASIYHSRNNLHLRLTCTNVYIIFPEGTALTVLVGSSPWSLKRGQGEGSMVKSMDIGLEKAEMAW